MKETYVYYKTKLYEIGEISSILATTQELTNSGNSGLTRQWYETNRMVSTLTPLTRVPPSVVSFI